MPILTTENLSKSYRMKDKTVKALNGISLQLDAGDFCAVCGPSGSGKSTLLFCCGALLLPDSGRVSVNGGSLYEISSRERAVRRNRDIGFVFQRFHLIPYLTVLENVIVAANGASAEEDAAELLRKFGMLERLQHLPGELSAGERQRTALARSMINRPALILADEPTGSLDEANSAIVLQALCDYASAGNAVLMVTHDAAAISSAGKTVRLQDGIISADDPPQHTPTGI